MLKTRRDVDVLTDPRLAAPIGEMLPGALLTRTGAAGSVTVHRDGGCPAVGDTPLTFPDAARLGDFAVTGCLLCRTVTAVAHVERVRAGVRTLEETYREQAEFGLGELRTGLLPEWQFYSGALYDDLLTAVNTHLIAAGEERTYGSWIELLEEWALRWAADRAARHPELAPSVSPVTMRIVISPSYLRAHPRAFLGRSPVHVFDARSDEVRGPSMVVLDVGDGEVDVDTLTGERDSAGSSVHPMFRSWGMLVDRELWPVAVCDEALRMLADGLRANPAADPNLILRAAAGVLAEPSRH